MDAKSEFAHLTIAHVKTSKYNVGGAVKESHWVEVPKEFKGKRVKLVITEDV